MQVYCMFGYRSIFKHHISIYLLHRFRVNIYELVYTVLSPWQHYINHFKSIKFNLTICPLVSLVHTTKPGPDLDFLERGTSWCSSGKGVLGHYLLFLSIFHMKMTKFPIKEGAVGCTPLDPSFYRARKSWKSYFIVS